MSYTDDYLEYVDLVPDDQPAPGPPCWCDCHGYYDPDGLLCLDGHCEICGDPAGGDESMPLHPDQGGPE